MAADGGPLDVTHRQQLLQGGGHGGRQEQGMSQQLQGRRRTAPAALLARACNSAIRLNANRPPIWRAASLTHTAPDLLC